MDRKEFRSLLEERLTDPDLVLKSEGYKGGIIDDGEIDHGEIDHGEIDPTHNSTSWYKQDTAKTLLVITTGLATFAATYALVKHYLV